MLGPDERRGGILRAVQEEYLQVDGEAGGVRGRLVVLVALPDRGRRRPPGVLHEVFGPLARQVAP